MPKNTINQKILPEKNDSLPVWIGDTLTEIIENNQLKESPQETISKMEKNQPTNGELLSVIFKEYYKNEINLDELIDALKSQLNLTQKKAEKAGQMISQTALEASQRPISTDGKPPLTAKKPNGDDLYREAVE